MNKEKEKKRRSDIIFGILLASILGVLLNLFSNFYYDVFVTETVKWSKININHIIAWFAIFLAVWGFISFFIHDYENNPEMNISFWKRFADYFFNSFRPMKVLRYLSGIYLVLFSLFLIYISSAIIFIILEKINIIVAIISVVLWILMMLVFAYRKIFKK